jgi:hypothetical protein
MFRTQPTPDFSVAEHYGLRNTTCLYSKDVAAVLYLNIASAANTGTGNCPKTSEANNYRYRMQFCKSQQQKGTPIFRMTLI